MKKVLKKEDLFYDMARMLSEKFFEENPRSLGENLNCRFTLKVLESIPPIKIEVFTKLTAEDEDFYSIIATCGREFTNSFNGDFFEETILEAIFDILKRAYYTEVEE